MILELRIEHLKDKTKKTKRAILGRLRTDIKGLESISFANELDPESSLAKEIDKMIPMILNLKSKDIKKKDVAEKATNKIISNNK